MLRNEWYLQFDVEKKTSFQKLRGRNHILNIEVIRLALKYVSNQHYRSGAIHTSLFIKQSQHSNTLHYNVVSRKTLLICL